MTKASLLGVSVVLAAAGAMSAAMFPLQFKTLTAEQARQIPGGAGLPAALRVQKPPNLLKEPKALSLHPLYGQFGEATPNTTFLFRLDESKGTGKGYDRLLIDLNQNGDLTDDTPAVASPLPGLSASVPSGRELRLFGPIAAPATRQIGGGRPIYFAELYLNNRVALTRASTGTSLGYLRFRAGWYLEATVTVDGIRQTLAVYDGNANLHLGDPWQPRPSGSGREQDASWYFLAGDSFLCDADGSGRFDHDRFSSESSPWAPLIYFGAKPFEVRLAATGSSIQVEPWSKPLVDLPLPPRGDQMRTVTLAWENPAGQWQLLKPGVAGGKVRVPPGNYRLYSCVLHAGSGERQIMLSGQKRTMTQPVSVAVGRPAALACGAPLEARITTTKQSARPANGSPSTGLLGGIARALGYATPAANPVVRIQASLVGAGGETYTMFGYGKELQHEPPKPVLTITGKDGRPILRTTMEYG